jgi:hypothetical protein
MQLFIVHGYLVFVFVFSIRRRSHLAARSNSILRGKSVLHVDDDATSIGMDWLH